MIPHRSEHTDERTIGRLEAFSDIVMGFCMAEIGFNLVIAKDPHALLSSWPNLVAFAISFLFVSVLWWFHHKLFVTYFVLMPVTVLLNFVMLGVLALAVYFGETTAQFFISDNPSPLPTLAWMASLAVVYGIVCVQYVIGIAKRRDTLDAESMRWGVNRALRTGTVTVIVAAFAIAFYVSGHAKIASYAVVVLFALSMIARRRLVPKITASLLAGRAGTAT